MLSDLSRDLTPRFDRAGDAHAHLPSDPRRAAADRGDVSSVAANANYAVPVPLVLPRLRLSDVCGRRPPYFLFSCSPCLRSNGNI